jgi:two-component system, NarL family, sensor histidine kinase UhpB
MSLRYRLISLVCIVLLISLGLGSAIAYFNARHSVRHEMAAALLVGRRTAENAVERLRTAGDPARELDRLVASFDGDRHLRIRLNGKLSAVAAPAIERSVFGHVPGWFIDVIGVAAQTERIPVTINGRDYGTISIETDPYNETVEVWDEFTNSLVAPTVFCALTVLLIYFFVGRILQPLDRLAAALGKVGEGRYTTRISGRLPPELARLRDSFNAMTARLAQTDADNRRLNEQLLTFQDQERGDLARDLHDEVSPFLFAINIDTASALKLLAQDRAIEARDHLELIAEAVRHVQQQVQRMLGRLRPIGLEALGLPEAIDNIVSFWRRRRPDIGYEVSISADCIGLPEPTSTTICRIVQEALSNAVRHAEPRVITVRIERDRDPLNDCNQVRVEVADDGRGMDERNRIGYGLLGLGERVGAMGGRLSLANRPGAGFAVTALLHGSSGAAPHRSPLEVAD